MGSVISTFGFGGRLIPGTPTAIKDATTGRWAKLTEDLIFEYRMAAAEGINDFANAIAERSLEEVPREDDELADSCRYPENDPDHAATEHHLEATVEYDTVYAIAQHEGMATMHHHHPIVPRTKGGFLEGFFEDTKKFKEVTIEWVAEHYTVPGTKSHYLSDPYKAELPFFEEHVYERVQARFKELGG